MTYLYAGLGMAMLTAIMAMFEMASGITGQQMFSRPPVDRYMQSAAQGADRQFLELISIADSSWGSGDALCTKILAEIEKPGSRYGGLAGYTRSVATTSGHLRLTGACVLAKGEHRVLVAPVAGAGRSYGLYSCAPQNASSCLFEGSSR